MTTNFTETNDRKTKRMSEVERKEKKSRVTAATKFISFIKRVTTFTNINVLKIKSNFSYIYSLVHCLMWIVNDNLFCIAEVKHRKTMTTTGFIIRLTIS